MRRFTGLRSRRSYFSITGVELRAPGTRLPPNLRDSSRQWPIRAWLGAESYRRSGNVLRAVSVS